MAQFTPAGDELAAGADAVCGADDTSSFSCTGFAGAAAGARSLRQAERCWREGADPVAFAQENKEFARAFESFSADADEIYPGWRNALNVAA